MLDVLVIDMYRKKRLLGGGGGAKNETDTKSIFFYRNYMITQRCRVKKLKK